MTEAEQGEHETEKSDPVQNWRFRLIETEVLLWQGKTKDALSLLQSPPIQVQRDAGLEIRTILFQLRAFHSAKEDAAAALIAQARSLAESAHPELLGEVTLVQGNLTEADHEYAAAESDFRRSVQLAQQYHQPLLEAKGFGSLSHLSTELSHYDQAIEWGLNSLQVAQSAGARHIEAATQLNVGWLYLELGDFAQAIQFLNTAEQLTEQSGMDSMTEKSLNNLARIYTNDANFSKAEENFQRALEIATNLHDDLNRSIYLDNIAVVKLESGQLDEAQKYNEEALEIQHCSDCRSEELRSQYNAALILSARKEFPQATSQLKSIIKAKETPESVRWDARDELAKIYVAGKQIALAEAQFKEALRLIDESWATIKQSEGNLAFSSWAADFYTDYLRFLLGQGHKEKALQIAESMRARTLEEGLGTRKTRQQPLLQIPGLQKYLRSKNRAVLAYWLAPEQSFLWLVTPSQVQIFFLPDKRKIDNKIEEYQKTITGLDDPLRDSKTGQELYQILVEKAEKFIPPGMSVAIIPDGGLGKLNFETLIVPGASPHYWINDRELEDSSSISLLMQSRPDHPGDHRLLIIGDPIEVTSEYGKLRHASDEINSAARHFSATAKKVVSGSGATPASYAANKPAEYDLVHFATHGFASDTRPLDSAIILSANPDGNFKLYARDIIPVPIKAEVVTISACYGAGERTYSGQGLVGLAWAFLRAGAHRVIAGLWKVDDDSTPQLMDTFYADLQNHMKPAAALRDAKRKMLDSGGLFHLPYYWASLQLYAGS